MTTSEFLTFALVVVVGVTLLVAAVILIVTRQQGTTVTRVAIEVAQAVRMDKPTLDMLEKGITQTVPKDTLAQLVNVALAGITLAAGGNNATGDTKELSELLKQVIRMISDGQPNDTGGDPVGDPVPPLETRTSLTPLG